MVDFYKNYEKLYDDHADKLIARSGPKDGVIYHYTDATGLFGILETGQLRATDYRFLNDKSEFFYGIEMAKSLCQDLRKKSSNIRLKNFLSLVQEYLEIPDDENRNFVASFTERKDDLSQWRGYANDGQGYTLGLHADWFTTKCLGDDCTFSFSKVSYSPDSFRKRTSQIIQSFFETLPQRSSAEMKDEAASWCDLAIENMSATHKHHSFDAECEWRVKTHLFDDDLKDIKTRPRANGLIPYTEIDLRDQNGKIPLHSIGIGPSIPQIAAGQAVSDLCRQFGYDCEIYNAETPYSRV